VIPDDGRLLLVEEMVAPLNQPGGKVMDLLMAAVGGQERTEQEWRARPAEDGRRRRPPAEPASKDSEEDCNDW
jgi:hypothetical protein